MSLFNYLVVLRLCYVRLDYKSSSNLPFVGVIPAHFDGGEPSVLDQDSGCSDCTFSVSSGVRAIDVNFSHADGVFGPALQPVEQFLCGLEVVVRLFYLLLGW